jgi:hypothetical protein
MEFVFYPLGWAEPCFPRWRVDLSLVDSVRVTDSRGDEFLKETLRDWGYKDGKEGNHYARDRSARLVAQKDREGGVYAHLEDLTEEIEGPICNTAWDDISFSKTSGGLSADPAELISVEECHRQLRGQP